MAKAKANVLFTMRLSNAPDDAKSQTLNLNIEHDDVSNVGRLIEQAESILRDRYNTMEATPEGEVATLHKLLNDSLCLVSFITVLKNAYKPTDLIKDQIGITLSGHAYGNSPAYAHVFQMFASISVCSVNDNFLYEISFSPIVQH